MIEVGFANCGRDVPAEVVRRAMQQIDGAFGDGPAVVGLNEIGEGDKGYDDRALMEAAFARWTITHARKREPILLLGIDPIKKLSHSYRGCAGYPHQTPARTIQQTVVPTKGEPDAAVLCVHPPAGARNGDREPPVKAALENLYVKLERRENHVTDLNLEAGRHVVKVADRNWRNYHPRPREVIVENHGPDYISVIPAPGYEVEVLAHDWKPLPIEALHGLLTARIQFHKV